MLAVVLVPAIWSVREMWPGDNYQLALAYFQTGLADDGWSLLRGTFPQKCFSARCRATSVIRRRHGFQRLRLDVLPRDHRGFVRLRAELSGGLCENRAAVSERLESRFDSDAGREIQICKNADSHAL